MKFLKVVLAVSIFSVVQAAQHPAEKLAHAFIALVGVQYGKASSMSAEFEAAVDALYSEKYSVISNDEVIVSSRASFKEHLEKAKSTAGFWRVTDVVYVPDAGDRKSCKITFQWWTEKNGVFAIEADMQSSDDGSCIEFVEETAEHVHTVDEVS